MQHPAYICCFGEVLWDMLPSGKLPGGAPMNVATHLQNLGINAPMISRVGSDTLGEEIKAFLQAKGCTTDWIQADEAYQTGVVTVHLSATNDATYDIVQPVAWDFIQITDALKTLASEAYAIVFGSLACRSLVARQSLIRLLKASGKHALKIFDVNFRAPHYSQSIVEILVEHADIVKLNEDELKIIAQWYAITGDHQQQLTWLLNHFNLQAILLTKGGDGAALLTKDDTGKSQFYVQQGYSVVVADTIGSGDSFLAGFLKNKLLGKSPAEALDYACALGALVASYKGANPPITEEDIWKMQQSQLHENQ